MTRCIIIGNESLALACAAELERAGHEVVAFVADPGAPFTRASAAGLPTLPSLQALRQAAPPDVDFLFSITNLRVLPADILALARVAAINYHDGPLPRYAGLHVPVFALLAGEQRHGISWHIMQSGVDEGGVLRQALFDLHPDETALTLNTRCYEAALAEFCGLASQLPMLPNALVAPLDPATRCPLGRRPERGGVIDWAQPSDVIARTVRALDHGNYRNPVATAKTSVDGVAIVVAAAESRAGGTGAAPGTVMLLDDNAVTVATGHGTLRLTRLLTVDGHVLDAVALARLGIVTGKQLDAPAPGHAAALDRVHTAVGRDEGFWMERLSQLEPAEVPGIGRARGETSVRRHVLALPEGTSSTRAIAVVLAWVARVSAKERFHAGYSGEWLEQLTAGTGPWFAPLVPLLAVADDDLSFADFERAVTAELSTLQKRGTWSIDAWARFHGMRPTPPPAFDLVIRRGIDAPAPGAALTCCISEGVLTWWVDSSRVADEAVARLAAQFHVLATAALQAPETPLGRLPVVPAAERDRLLVQFNATERPVAPDATMPSLFAAQAARSPDAIAAVFDDAKVSYSELERRARRLANHLRALGVGADTIVGLHVQRSVRLVEGALGIQMAGAAYLPLDPSYPADRLAFMLNDAKVTVVVSEEGTRSALPSTDAVIVSLDGDGPALAQESITTIEPQPQPGDLAYVIYTSGSTGLPKGVMVEHRNVVNFFTGMDECIGSTPGVWLAVTSLSFDISVLELLWTLTRGFTVVIYREEDRTLDTGSSRAGLAATIPELIHHHRVTHLQCTPSLITMLLHSDDSRAALGQLRQVLVGGEAMPGPLAETLATLVQGGVHNMYGPTETTVWSTSHRVGPLGDAPPIGRPIANTQLYVLDQKQRLAPLGATGELYIGGAGVVRGYLHRPELTAQRFIPSPFDSTARLYRTGDLVRYRDDGVVEYIGRADFQVKLRGHRIELGEIEHHLRQMPGIDEAVAMVREDAPGDPRLVAYVVVSGPGVELPVLRERLKSVVPDYMVPSHLVSLNAFPLTPNLKIDRRALPAPVREALRGPVSDRPRAGIESDVAGIWASVLGVSEPGRNDNFFDLGGHSLLAMRLHARLREQYPDRPLTVTDIFRYPTIAALAPMFGRASEPSGPKAVTAHPEAVYFSAGQQRIFGMFHSAGQSPARGAVLCCYPLPPKYMLCYRAFQRLSAGLARAGYDVLRFDYSGIGDSSGDPSATTIEQWTVEVDAALAYLRLRSDASRISLVGMRLGAALAGHAALRPGVVDRLVLWEPVLVGATYVAEFDGLMEGRGDMRRDGQPFDFFGFRVSSELQRGLQRMSLLEVPPQATRTLLLETECREESVALSEKCAGLEHVLMAGLGHWRQALANDSVIVPANHLQRILQFLTAE